MRKRASVDAVGGALLAALGLLGGCGGTIAASGDGDGGGPSPTGGGGACTLHPCLNPSPFLIAGIDTGYDTCQGTAPAPGYSQPTLRRRAIMDCPSLLPRASVGAGACPVTDGGANSACARDEGCTSQPNGYCSGCYCYYGCLRDSDCGSGSICVCDNPVGRCRVSSCSSGGTCLPGCDCVSPFSGFSCQTPADTCISSLDCYRDTNGSTVCDGPMGGPRPLPGLTCQPLVSTHTGRPFLVHGSERLAECVASGDWRSPNVAPDLHACSASARIRLAAHWARVGLMEHASIAAFARFTLHLLALGAPPDLVSASQRAIGDETEHARLAFSLASAYAGTQIGPGALAIDGSLDGFNVVDLVATLLREGCIGETVAAIEARDALENVGDPAVRTVLETIARDELRHAELAWRTLGWLVASGRANRVAVRDEVTKALGEMTSSARRAEPSEDLGPFGVVSYARQGELRSAAATRVIRRCAEALLGRDGHTGQRSRTIATSGPCPVS
jgi:hypothetical protein